MREEVRVLVGETQEDGTLDAEINRHINLGQCAVAENAAVLFTHVLESTVAYNDPTLDPIDPRREGRYGLPQDFLKVRAIEVLDGNTWYPVQIYPYEKFRAHATQTNNGGKMLYAKIEFGATSLDGDPPGDIWFYPWPDRAAPDGYVYRISYTQIPTAMTDDGHISELPHFAHMAVCVWAALMVSRKHRDRGLINEMSALWQMEMDKVMRVVGSQRNDLPKRQINIYR